MKQLLLIAGIALLCLGESEDDHLNAQSLTADAKINAIPQNPADIPENPADIPEDPARTFRKPIDRKPIDRKRIALKTADTLRWIFRIS
ncbi:MAG TPA: hypothetical protein VL978_07915, partial [Puia sp.]|nr:hypothetical protein [Puia sp.]